MTHGFRFSPQQEHLWALQQADRSPVYRSRCAVMVEGELDLPALEAALLGLVARHEILRTVCRQPRGADWAAQLPLDPPQGFPLAVRDAEGRSRETVAEELLAGLTREPLDPGQLPVLRAALARLSATRHVLALELPALCCDAAGLRNLVAELARAWAVARGGQDDRDEPMQYADLAEWLNTLLEGENAAAGTEHWHRLDLSGLVAFKLPFERLATGGSAFAPESVRRTLPVSLAEDLEALSRGRDLPLSSLLLAAWQALLWHLVRQPEVIVGVAGSGRSYPGLEEALGLLSRHLPVPAAVAGEDPFSALAERAARAAAEALDWQEYFTWAPIRKAMGHARGSLFFPVAFELREAAPAAAGGGLAFEMVREEAWTDRFRLKLAVLPAGGTLVLELQYDSHLIGREDAERLAAQLETLLEGVARRPDAAIGELPILSPGERRRLFEDFNRTRVDYGCELPVHRLFEEQAAARPEAPAVAAGGSVLTYRELDERSNRLAHYLRELGVGPETRVGLCIDRSVDMAVGALGILKAGGAYVPLDPGYPEERLAFMLRDACMPVLVCRRHLLAALPAPEARIVDLDGDAPALAAQSAEALPPLSGGSNAAYVIYTSGSTGAPRGVIIEHRNLCHYAQAMAEPLALTPADRFLHTASVAFSSSVRQLLVPLAHGAEVVVAGSDERRDPLALMALVAREGVTIMDLVPSHWRSVTHALSRLAPEARAELLENRVRLVLSASEPLLSDVPRTWSLELGHRASLINMFGQTETTGIVATRPIQPRAGEPVRGVPIGPPIANTQIYLLDERMRPVATGVAGRVYIGGLGLGRGYLGRPELTAERLVPNPFSPEPGARLYDTGDLARFQADGGIEFVGRGDHQVKIRGLRVELGEIEAALGEHPEVREAVVTAREDVAGDPRLVGYVVPRQQPAPSVDGLRVFLQEKVPEYMIPSFWVLLDELPLTPNGKVDRLALPAPDRSRGALGTEYAAPRDTVEERLVEIWASLLGLDQIGIHDNFFKLGGHSLLGTVLMSRVRDAFEIDLPVLRLFEAPTVAGLSDVVRWQAGQGRAGGRQEEIAPAERADDGRLLAQVDSMSSEQVDALLSELLGEEEAAL